MLENPVNSVELQTGQYRAKPNIWEGVTTISQESTIKWSEAQDTHIFG
jgi:hypothetical protein